MKNKITFISAIIIVVLSITSYTLMTGSQALSVKEFQEQACDGNAQLVDIRNSEDYLQEHISNAVNIDFSSKFFIESFSSFNKDLPLFIYCKTGFRTSEAAPVLEGVGFREVYYLKGGINAWKEQGLKVEVSDRATVLNK